jgi:hypothetical protein
MKTIAVESTTLRTVAYDTNQELLQIEFLNRAVYQYLHVPADIHKALLQAPSKGIYFNRFIRQKFPHALIKAASLS